MWEESEIRTFAKLWQDEFGEELSLDQVRRNAMLLLELYALIYDPNENNPSSTH